MTTTDPLALLASLAGPFLDPASRTWWPALLASGALALGLRASGRIPWTFRGAWSLLRHPSSQLDVQLLLSRQFIRLLLGGGAAAGAWALGTHTVRALDRVLGAPQLQIPTLAAVALTSLLLFLVWDLSRFLLHLAMHRIPVLWQFHQVHHSAEVLTPLTFHRIHPIESLLYTLRGSLFTGLGMGLCFWLFRDSARPVELLGVPAAGLLLNVAMGNLRHSQLWLPFPAPVERWLLSPAQHQVHHSADPREAGSNLGTWLAVWDRLAGTLRLAERPPARFGLAPSARNHGHDLLSAWFGPFRAGSRWRALALLLLAPLAHAEEPPAEEPPAEEEEADMVLIIQSEGGAPRVAGSAQVVGDEVLERYAYDNVEQALAQVPGVSTRNEDGFGLRPNIGIRGANSDRSAKITLMEDGVLLAPAPYAAPAAYYFPMMARISGIEVIKGAAATRHGPQTVGGALNLLSRPIPQTLEGAVELAGGSYLTGRAHGWGGGRWGAFGLMLEGVHLRSDGFKELPGGEPTGFNKSEGTLKLGLWPVEGQRFELKLGLSDETSHEDYLGLTLADLEQDPHQRYAASALGLMRFQRTQAVLSWEAEAGSELRVRTVAYHQALQRAWTKLNGFANGTDIHSLLQADPSGGTAALYLAILRGEEDSQGAEQALLIGTNDRRFQSVGLQSEARWTHTLGPVAGTLETGLRLHQDRVVRLHDEKGYDMLDGALVDRGEDLQVTTDSLSVAQALALHAHEELDFGALILLPGGRVEVVRTFVDEEEADTRVVGLPGIAAMLRPDPLLDIFAGLHRGFSPVSPGQAPEVRPELAWTAETGLRLHREEALAEVVGFLVDYANLTGECTMSSGCDSDAIGQQFNGGRALVLGVEALGQLRPAVGPFHLPLQASYAYTHSSFLSDFRSDFSQFGDVQAGDRLPYSPEHQLGGRLALEHERFDLGAGASWRSAMLDVAGDFPATETDVPALLLVDAAVGVRVHRLVGLRVVGSNLADAATLTSWRPMGARPTPPRMVMLSVTVGEG
mgnify:CR=1 FL=1